MSTLEFPASFSNARLRDAIRNNLVTFPSQTIWFKGRGEDDVRWRIAELYFVSGWPLARICLRLGLSKQAVRNILNHWRHRAVAGGFVQEIQPGS